MNSHTGCASVALLASLVALGVLAILLLIFKVQSGRPGRSGREHNNSVRMTKFHKSSKPFLSVDLWHEIAQETSNVIFVERESALKSALDRAGRRVVVLVANNFDDHLPSNKRTQTLLENHPLLIRLFAKNAAYVSARVGVLPIGPKWQYRSHRLYGESKEKRLGELHELGLSAEHTARLFSQKKEPRILVPPMTDDFRRSSHYQDLRGAVAADKIERSLVDLNGKASGTNLATMHVTFKEYMSKMQSFAFVFSPPGNGFDCHRHWEALMMGAIPIILRSNVTSELFLDLPVWLVENYGEVRNIDKKYAEIFASAHNFSRLYADHWAMRIAGIASTPSIQLKTAPLAVYTVVTGGYEKKLRTNPEVLGVPCFVVSDQPRLADRGWTFVPVSECDLSVAVPKQHRSRKATWRQRSLKVCPERIPALRSFSQLLYIDGNIELTPVALRNLVEAARSSPAPDIITIVNQERISARSELDVISRRWNQCEVESIAELFVSSGFEPDKFGLSQTNVLWRSAPMSTKMKQFGRLWLTTMLAGPCWRDQSAFDYAVFASGLQIRREIERERSTLPEHIRRTVPKFTKPLGFRWHHHG
tara:strand:+ start:6179 stop:7948 length:1770 start_codon:yes stop_codon:yes gene_type:complete